MTTLKPRHVRIHEIEFKILRLQQYTYLLLQKFVTISYVEICLNCSNAMYLTLIYTNG